MSAQAVSRPGRARRLAGWWFWAPRCVVARQTATGWATRITHAVDCPG